MKQPPKTSTQPLRSDRQERPLNELLTQFLDRGDQESTFAESVSQLDLSQYLGEDPWQRGAKYDFGTLAGLFIYQHGCGISKTELSEQLQTSESLRAHFGLDHPPILQTLHYTWRERFTRQNRALITSAGIRLYRTHMLVRASTDHSDSTPPQ